MLETDVARLLGRPVASVEHLGGGGNSRIYRVTAADGQVFALKSYPSLAQDRRDRLGTEFAALAFLSAHPQVMVPRPIACDRTRLLALYEWVDGGRPAVSAGVIDAMLEFMAAVHGLRDRPGADALPLAIECCLSGAEILRQVRRRLERLRGREDEEALQAFLGDEVAPVLESLALDDDDLPPGLRCLNPGDFGAHNMLAAADRTTFIDFEYFGWDDPTKQVSDVLWHPAMLLGPELAERFRAGALALYGAADADFADRLRRVFPAYGLRWIMIILNEFLPERWAVRAHAGAADQAAAKARQLAKARAFLERVRAAQRNGEAFSRW